MFYWYAMTIDKNPGPNGMLSYRKATNTTARMWLEICSSVRRSLSSSRFECHFGLVVRLRAGQLELLHVNVYNIYIYYDYCTVYIIC